MYKIKQLVVTNMNRRNCISVCAVETVIFLKLHCYINETENINRHLMLIRLWVNVCLHVRIVFPFIIT